MKIRLYAFVLILGTVISCHPFIKERGNGVIESRSWNVADFSKIELQGAYEVELSRGETPEVVIETDENLFDYIDVNDRGRVLEIISEDRIKSSDGIRVYITYRELNGIYAGGAADIEATEKIKTDYLELDMSGAGLIDLEIEADELTINISGAGAVRLSGDVTDLEVDMSGAGDLKAYDLRSKFCKVSISGLGSSDVFVTEDLKARVSGVGGVSYIGNPPRVDSDVSGLGKVSPDRSRNNL